MFFHTHRSYGAHIAFSLQQQYRIEFIITSLDKPYMVCLYKNFQWSVLNEKKLIFLIIIMETDSLHTK